MNKVNKINSLYQNSLLNISKNMKIEGSIEFLNGLKDQIINGINKLGEEIEDTTVADNFVEYINC